MSVKMERKFISISLDKKRRRLQMSSYFMSMQRLAASLVNRYIAEQQNNNSIKLYILFAYEILQFAPLFHLQWIRTTI